MKRAIWWLAAFAVMVSCKQGSEQVEKPSGAEISATVSSKEQVKGGSGSPICDRFIGLISEQAKKKVIGVKAQIVPGLPLRCTYEAPRTEEEKVSVLPFFEIQQGVTLEKRRQELETLGKVSASPSLGEGAFRANFSFLNWVIGAKGNVQLTVGGSASYEELEKLWHKIAATL